MYIVAICDLSDAYIMLVIRYMHRHTLSCLSSDKTLDSSWRTRSSCIPIPYLADWTPPNAYSDSGGIRQLCTQFPLSRFGIAPIIIRQQVRDGCRFGSGREIDIGMWKCASRVNEVSAQVQQDKRSIGIFGKRFLATYCTVTCCCLSAGIILFDPMGLPDTGVLPL